MNVAGIKDIEEFMVRGQAFTERLAGLIASDSETHSLVVLGALLTLTGRTCVALKLSSADAVQGFVMALADANESLIAKPEGPVQ